MRIGVVGAGPSGLCAARHATAAGMSCTVFEQSDDLGGTWIYTDNAGRDKYGLPVHSSMYRNLRINFPKEIVSFPDFQHNNVDESYITGVEMLEYLNNYADHFGIRDLIKVNTHVKKVTLKENKWEVVVLDLPSNKEEVFVFDAIFICSGLCATPVYPQVNGMDKFLGKSMHSHEYRTPEPFTNQRVLVIGAGPSGMDLSHQVATKATKVFLSHHTEHISNCRLQENVIVKYDVKEIKAHSVVFEDDSEEELDCIIYGTGYKVTYAFLDSSSDISIDLKLVYPLYKNFINANHPTMAIFGQMEVSIQNMTFDIQVRFFLKSLVGDILPSKEEMLKDADDFIQLQLQNGKNNRNIFKTTTEQDREYYNTLSAIAKIDNLPNVYFHIHKKALFDCFNNFPDFRNNVYTIHDDENFTFKPKSELI